MQNKTLLVAKREYLSTVTKPSFWISTFLFPVFILIIAGISGASSFFASSASEEEVEKAKLIYVQDEAGIVNQQFIQDPYQQIDNKEKGIEAVKQEEAEAFIYYPENVISNNSIELYSQQSSPFTDSSFADVAQRFLKQSILLELQDPNKIKAFNADYEVETTTYKNGEEVAAGFARLIIPIGFIILYIILVFTSVNYLLRSVSEEKENRMIEIMLSTLHPRQLVWGKIVGQVSIVFTQLSTFLVFGILALVVADFTLPAFLQDVSLQPGQSLLGLFYLLTGFLTLAGIMVGAAAAMPTYRDAQSFSSIFMIGSLLPLYFIAILIADPNGPVAMITSYLPLTSPIVLLFRNALGELATIEYIISPLVLVAYTVLSFYFAFKMFELGSLEYSHKVTIKNFLLGLKPKKNKSQAE